LQTVPKTLSPSFQNALLGLLTTALGQASSKLSSSSRKLNLNLYCFPSRFCCSFPARGLL